MVNCQPLHRLALRAAVQAFPTGLLEAGVGWVGFINPAHGKRAKEISSLRSERRVEKAGLRPASPQGHSRSSRLPAVSLEICRFMRWRLWCVLCRDSDCAQTQRHPCFPRPKTELSQLSCRYRPAPARVDGTPARAAGAHPSHVHAPLHRGKLLLPLAGEGWDGGESGANSSPDLRAPPPRKEVGLFNQSGSRLRIADRVPLHLQARTL